MSTKYKFHDQDRLGTSSLCALGWPDILAPAEGITSRLFKASKEGKDFMGFKVTETGNKENMFVLEKKL